MKYVVYKQPLSLDRFFIHEMSPAEMSSSKLENAFVLICLNRFQQIVQVHTFQAETEIAKVRKAKSLCNDMEWKSLPSLPLFPLQREWLTKLREAQEIWRRTLQTTIFKGVQSAANNRSSAQSSPTLGE